MTDRLDALTPVPGKDGKTWFRRIGTAWQTRNGWAVTLEALPLPFLNDKGQMETKILLMPPKDQSSAGNADADAPF